MADHPGAAAINNLNSALGIAQHNIHDKGWVKNLVEHLSGVGHLEVLGLAKGQAPIKGDYDAWLKTDAGKAATAGNKLNAAYVAVIHKVFDCYTKASKYPPDPKVIKAQAGIAAKAAEDFIKANALEGTNHGHAIDAKIKEVKKFA
jgi:hypothetical protein